MTTVISSQQVYNYATSLLEIMSWIWLPLEVNESTTYVDYALKWGIEKADHNQVCKASLISVPKSHSIVEEKADTKYNDSMQK